jgi:signal transduction histidine kinase/PAS domain-containing protein
VIEALRRDGAWTGEWANRRKDGTEFPTWSRITALEMGGRQHWVCVQEDITERKRAEAEVAAAREEAEARAEEASDLAARLQEQAAELEHQVEEVRSLAEDLAEANLLLAEAAAEARLARDAAEEARRRTADVLESITDAFFAVDHQWRFTYVNARAEQVVGRARADLLGKSLWEEFPGFVGTAYWENAHRAVRERVPVHFEDAAPSLGIWTEMRLYPTPDGLAVYYHDASARRRAEVATSLLARAGAALAGSLDQAETLSAVAAVVVPELADWCSVDMVEDGEIRQLAVAHADPERVKWAREIRLRYPPDANEPIGLPQVLRTGEPELYGEIPDEILVGAARDEEHLTLLREVGFASAMIVPLRTRGAPFGAITFVAAESGRRYTEGDLALAGELAARAALAVEHARAFRDAQAARAAAERAAERTARLQSLTAALAEALTPRQVARVVVEQGVAALEADAGVIVLTSEDGAWLEMAGSSGYAESTMAGWDRFPLSADTPLSVSVRTRKPVALPTLADRARRFPALGNIATEYAATLSVPLVVEGTPVGAMGLSFHQEREVGPEEHGYLMAIGRQCAQAVRRARLYEAEAAARREAQRAERRVAFLAEASGVLGAALDYEGNLAAAARLAVPFLCDFCMVDVVDRDGMLRRLAHAHADPEGEAILGRTVAYYARATTPGGPLMDAVLQEEPRVVEVTEEWMAAAARSPEHLEDMRRLGFRWLMLVPLRARGARFGVMTFCSAGSGRRYGADDLVLAQELARRAASAVDNARLYEEAQEANRAKAGFLATMSHELRTPLNAILGYADLLDLEVAGPLADAQRKQLGRIQAGGRHLLQLIEEILTFSRIEAGREEVHWAPADVGEIAREAAALVEPLAAAKRLGFSVRVGDGAGEAETDPGKVRQILLNLLSNAVKFTDAGEVALEAEADGGGWTVRVRDTGIGIEREHAERIFDPFSQVEQSPSRRVEGTGLGLTVSRQLARLLGGDVEMESVPGVGSTFTVRLPNRAAAPGEGG